MDDATRAMAQKLCTFDTAAGLTATEPSQRKRGMERLQSLNRLLRKEVLAGDFFLLHSQRQTSPLVNRENHHRGSLRQCFPDVADWLVMLLGEQTCIVANNQCRWHVLPQLVDFLVVMKADSKGNDKVAFQDEPFDWPDPIEDNCYVSVVRRNVIWDKVIDQRCPGEGDCWKSLLNPNFK